MQNIFWKKSNKGRRKEERRERKINSGHYVYLQPDPGDASFRSKVPARYLFQINVLFSSNFDKYI
jgi:hypothetical protein